MLKRIAISGFAGFIVATFLFSMMQTLIAMGDVDLDKSKGPKVIDFRTSEAFKSDRDEKA